MRSVSVKLNPRYDILIGSGVLAELPERLPSLLKGRHLAILSDSNVWPLYGEKLSSMLTDAGFFVSRFVFPAGEASKNPQTLFSFLSFLAKENFTREDTVVALGGGVTGDLAGLAASLYQRGIACVQIPTSLLAMVDSSVGGKTAVDLPEGKNLVGTFSQPVLVVCDTNTLKTLPDKVCAEGFAEIIKYGMIKSPSLLTSLSFHTLDSIREKNAKDELEGIIAKCIEIKRDVVERDELDHGERQLLNFGHTLGHAIEQCSAYAVPHGEAVAIGMALMTRGCAALSRCSATCVSMLEKLLEAYRLPNSTAISEEDILSAAGKDKKRRGDTITLVEPVIGGECRLHKSNLADLADILKAGYRPDAGALR